MSLGHPPGVEDLPLGRDASEHGAQIVRGDLAGEL
jgi:hypothetical protein